MPQGVCVVLTYLTPWMKASKVSWKCVPNVEASKDECVIVGLNAHDDRLWNREHLVRRVTL